MFVCYWFWLVDLCAWPVRCGCAPASAGRCRGIIFSVLEINLQFFSAKIYKGRKRLRAGNFFHSMGAGRGRSVCPFVSVSWTFVHQCRGGGGRTQKFKVPALVRQVRFWDGTETSSEHRSSDRLGFYLFIFLFFHFFFFFGGGGVREKIL
jgi:hypothetical protein